VPIESVTAGLNLSDLELDFADLDLRLSGGGRLQGSGSLRDAELALRLAVTALDASALHSDLRRTQLAGSLRARIGLNSQQLEGKLRDPHFAIEGKLAIDPAEVTVETLQLSSGDAQLIASGKVALVDTGQFTVAGSLKDFDPSRFAKLPAARLTRRAAASRSSPSDCASSCATAA